VTDHSCAEFWNLVDGCHFNPITHIKTPIAKDDPA
jgi:hypothetical protein